VELKRRAFEKIAGGEDQERAVTEEEPNNQQQHRQDDEEQVWITRGIARAKDQQHERAHQGKEPEAQGKVEACMAGRFVDGIHS